MPSRLHHSLPAPGVWDPEGWAQRRAKHKIGSDMVTTHEGAVEGDFLHTNSFFSNGGHSGANYVAKEVHLGASLVPLAPPPASASVRSPPTSPSRRISAITFDWRQAEVANYASPKRSSPGMVSSASMPALSPTMRRVGESGKQYVPLYSERRLQEDNRQLAEYRAASVVHERKREMQEDLSRGGAWDTRWGFTGRACVTDARSRRRPDPTYLKPTLAGFAL